MLLVTVLGGRCRCIYEASTKVIAYYYVICSYFIQFLVEGVGRNWCQSSVFYLASSPTCGRGLLVNSQQSIFYIGNPTKGWFLSVGVRTGAIKLTMAGT